MLYFSLIGTKCAEDAPVDGYEDEYEYGGSIQPVPSTNLVTPNGELVLASRTQSQSSLD